MNVVFGSTSSEQKKKKKSTKIGQSSFRAVSTQENV